MDPNLENYPYTYSHIVVPCWGYLIGSLIYLSIEWVKPRKGPTMDTIGSWYRCMEPWGRNLDFRVYLTLKCSTFFWMSTTFKGLGRL